MSHTHDSGSKVRSLYFYIASLITLGFVIGSLVALLMIGMQAWVFSAADPAGYRIGPPPEPFITSLVSDATGETTGLSCTDACLLSDDAKHDLVLWQEQYASWEQRMANPHISRIERLITALSMLIIAVPLYIIHFRIVQRERKQGAPLPSIRTSYFYLVSLAALLMVVIAGSVFINSILRLWLIPESTNTIETVEMRLPASAMGPVTISTIQSCGDVCELDPALVAAAGTWQDDYDQWQQAQQQYDPLQYQVSSSLPFVLLGIPLFWFHWRFAREKKESDASSSEPPTNTQ